MTKLAPQARVKKTFQATSGQIRIIGGQWRGRKLPVPNSPGLRPTTDRVRETLFNWLAPMIQGARCLDCFAGSGALGLEALSRYASSATLLEYERPVAQQLEKNLALLQGHGEVINTNALTWLAGNGKPFDVVFLDPPFRQGLLAGTATLLEQQGWLMKPGFTWKPKQKAWRRRCQPTGGCTARKSPVRWHTVFIFVREKKPIMLINLGRLLILCVWGFLLFNLFHPFPKPLKYFIDVALFFMVVMHGLQLVLLKATQPISYWQETKIFIFGLFELLAWQKKQPPHKNK